MNQTMNETMMQTILMDELMHGWKVKMLIPNSTSVFPWEADLLAVVQSGLSHEFEIKVSKADFRADGKKLAKHGSLANQYVINVKQTFHNRLDQDRAEELRQRMYSYGIVPSYFWYVVYGFDVSVDEIPPYAGLIKITDRIESSNVSQFTSRYNIDIEKKAPRLNTDKFSDRTMARIARLLSFRLADSHKATQNMRLKYTE